jgi:hypothetical protein
MHRVLPASALGNNVRLANATKWLNRRFQGFSPGYDNGDTATRRYASHSRLAFCIVFSRVACYNSRLQEFSARIGLNAIKIQNYEIS